MRAPLHTTLQAAAKLAPWLLVFVVCGMSCSDETLGPDSNAAPGKPQTPQGPAVAVINARTNYSSSAVDPDNDPVALWFFW
ncbi:MAG: hypothetical protein ACE5GA_09405, partial [Candidatus Zixiibacteriota bacterium]